MAFGDVDVEAFTGFGTGGGYMPADTVDEQASDTGMSGPASLANRAGLNLFGGSPTRSLVALWFTALAAYWALGYFFKGARS